MIYRMSFKNIVAKGLFQVVSITVLFSLTSACAGNVGVSPEPTQLPAHIVLTDGAGSAVELSAPAQRVVSLAPTNTEILFAVGAGAQVVGRDTFSDYPAEATAITDVGGGFSQLNMEVIVSLKPDLVLTSMLTPPEQIQSLQELGLTVYTVSNPQDFEGIYENLRAIASLTGHSSQAEQLIGELQKRVKDIEDRLPKVTERPLVFYEVDGTDPNAPWTAGPGSFANMLIHMAGAMNLGSELSSEWVQISIEELIARDPDIILIGDSVWGGVTVQDVQKRPGWDALSAIRNGKTYPFDDNLISRFGPRVVDGFEAMAKLLHPELFQ